MKNLLTILFAISALQTMAATYTTMASGNWNDPSIWSTDGGITSCGCVPSVPTAGDDIFVYHNVTMTTHLGVSGGSYIYVDAAGSLYGPSYNLTTWGSSTIDIYGPCTFQKLINGFSSGLNGSTVNLYSIVEITGRIQLYAGLTTVDGGLLYLPSGNFDNYANGSFITANGAQLELYGGNISNDGLIDICSDCCLETVGNWTNTATGLVAGSGSAQTTGGNMNNAGVFSALVTWCSAGFDAGMPGTEDCTSAGTTCGLVTLPVEMVSFDAVNRGEYNELNWETASEQESDYFMVQRSTDGYNWVDVEKIDAAGTTQEYRYYQFNDYEIADLTYYRLEQVDINGRRHLSYPISVSRSVKEESLLLYPNPVSGSSVNVSGIQDGGQINVYNNAGTIVTSIEVANISLTKVEIDLSQLISGMYTIEQVSLYGDVRRAKLIVR